MPIDDLKTIQTLPEDLKTQIENVLNTRSNTSNLPQLLKGYEYIWALWDSENKDYTTWCAKLLASSFFLIYLKYVQAYLEEKYSDKIDFTNIFKEEVSLEKNIEALKEEADDKVAIEDVRWIRHEILPSIGRVITCVTSDNITTTNDLVAMANIGNKQVDLLENYLEEGEEKESQLREIFLTYIDNLISERFIDKRQYDIRDKMDYVQDFEQFASFNQNGYVAVGSIFKEREAQNVDSEIKKLSEISGQLEQ